MAIPLVESSTFEEKVAPNVSNVKPVGDGPSEHAENSDLLALGYEAELARSRGFSHIFSMTVTCLAVPYGIGSALYTAIIGGGPATLVWGSVLVCFVYWMQAYSLGELAERFPTSAGPYYWVYQVAPVKTRKALSYMTGWIILTGTIIVSLSVAFGLASHVIGTVNIFYPDYAAQQWVYILVTYGLLLLAATPVLFFPASLPWLDRLNFVWTWTYKVLYIVVMLARAKSGRRSATYAFTHYDPSFSGWGSGWTFFIGLLPAVYSNCSIGLVVSMAEEVKRPSRNVPRAMVWTMPCSLALAWAFVLPLTFTMPDMETLLEAPGGVVLPYAFKLIVGNDIGAMFMMIGILGIGFFCLVAINTAASRMLWSFSRDHAVPGSHLWSRVTAKGNIPAAICLSVTIQCLVCLIDLGSTLAFNSFVSAAIMAFNIGYLVPVLCSMYSRRERLQKLKLGPNWVGSVCNWGMLVWTCLATVLFSMPVTLPVTAQSMNYAAVVLGGFMLIAGGWYAIYARRVYKGPPTVSQLVDNDM